MFTYWINVIIKHKRMCEMSVTQPHSMIACFISSTFKLVPFNIFKDGVNFIELVFGGIPEFLKENMVILSILKTYRLQFMMLSYEKFTQEGLFFWQNVFTLYLHSKPTIQCIYTVFTFATSF